MKKHTRLQENSPILSVLVNYLMTFGSQLKAWRKAKGMTQPELAKAVGVNVSYISNLERDFSPNTKSGKPRPSEALVEKFSKVLEISLDEIRLAAGYAPLNNKSGKFGRILRAVENMPEDKRDLFIRQAEALARTLSDDPNFDFDYVEE
jgi:transcriptional regulator with XRE-family HTH domain